MDSKTLISRLSMESGKSAEEIASAIAAVTATLGAHGATLDAVAIPGFGTFTSTKSDERIITTPDGKRTLLPPAITVDFKSSVLLRKSLS